MYTVNHEWFETTKGNHVCCSGDDKILATVFRNRHDYWQIFINTILGGQLVSNEYYEDADEAIDRAEEILDGAPRTLLPPKF